jgi:membrane protein implicated in regulation of membrane protease activity
VELLFWHWFLLGLVLLIAEVVLGAGYFLIFVAAAALIVGVGAWVLPAAFGWEAQLVLFGVLSVASFFVWRRFSPGNPVSDQPSLNRRGHSYVGRTFTLAAPIVNGVGKLHVDDSQWRISGADADVGTQVKVVAVDGATLKVERA